MLADEESHAHVAFVMRTPWLPLRVRFGDDGAHACRAFQCTRLIKRELATLLGFVAQMRGEAA